MGKSSYKQKHEIIFLKDDLLHTIMHHQSAREMCLAKMEQEPKGQGIIKCYNRKIGLMLTQVQKKKAIMIYKQQREKILMINSTM